MNLTEKIIQNMRVVLEKPLMIFNNIPDVDDCKNYIDGYIHGIESALDINLTVKISEWFQKKVNEQAYLVWTVHLLDHFRDRTNEEKKELLVNTLIDFIKENPDWNIVK